MYLLGHMCMCLCNISFIFAFYGYPHTPHAFLLCIFFSSPLGDPQNKIFLPSLTLLSFIFCHELHFFLILHFNNSHFVIITQPMKFSFLFNNTPPSHGEGNGTPLQYSCLDNPMDGGAWQAEVHGVANSQTRLRDFTFIFHFHALEKEMTTHSSVLAWRIPVMGEPGGLLSMGSHRVGHD